MVTLILVTQGVGVGGMATQVLEGMRLGMATQGVGDMVIQGVGDMRLGMVTP